MIVNKTSSLRQPQVMSPCIFMGSSWRVCLKSCSLQTDILDKLTQFRQHVFRLFYLGNDDQSATVLLYLVHLFLFFLFFFLREQTFLHYSARLHGPTTCSGIDRKTKGANCKRWDVHWEKVDGQYGTRTTNNTGPKGTLI